MATETASGQSGTSMTATELVAYTKKELEADAARQAQQSAASGAELPRESQTGVTLDLSHKNIHALPVEVVGLIKDRVERLALSHNLQIAIPSQIIQCNRLRYLNIRWNHLKHFPEAVLQLSSLEILDVSKNKIESIPEDIKNMTSLKFLAIAKNRITRLPLALGDMATLSKLKFDENPIEFPPPEALKPSKDRAGPNREAEKEKDVCLLVKRYLRQCATRAKLKTESESDISESNVETPRPPKRTIGGRFPVKPSVSGIENISDLRSDGILDAPPIPQRSHARVLSSQNVPVTRRPGVAPLVTSDAASRSRSETVSSSSSRSKRLGYVPRKPSELGSVHESADSSSLRSSNASTIKAIHSRNTSAASTINGFLGVSSGGETSSGAVSPVDGPGARYGLGLSSASRRLSSLPEDRWSATSSIITITAAKRVLFTLSTLHRPTADIARILKDGTPKRTILERHLFSASANVEELDRLLSRFDIFSEENVGQHDEAGLKKIIETCDGSLKAYVAVANELKSHTRKVVTLADSVYVRCLMLQVYSTLLEARNVCTILGAKLCSPQPSKTPRASRTWSSRTVTPTQVKPVPNRRLRGATILQNSSNIATLRAVPPPVPISTNSSRTNTMTSLSAVTPRSGESFVSVSTTMLRSRSNTARSTIDDSDEGEQFERIFLKLKSVCQLANVELPRVRGELILRKDTAESTGQSRAAHCWALALGKCDSVTSAMHALKHRLSVIKVNDPSIRIQRDFWQLCDGLVSSWTELATEIKDLGSQRIDITNVKGIVRPIHKVMKEVSKIITDSPLYHQAMRPALPGALPTPGPHSLAPPFPTAINTGFAQALANHSGYVTPVPATPLSAALGPAAQATVASTPSTLNPPNEYFHPPRSAAHERVDTVMQHQPSVHGRR